MKNRRLYNSMKTNFRGFSGCKVDLSCDESVYPPLPFSMPAFGSQIVEFGAGLGQDTRNLARAGYQVLGVEVSGDAVAEARALTASSDMNPEALDRWSYINYDALALPKCAISPA
jgi:2-polyprenyl-3-methyl-5-hydroxy-6-metoxy-1,4-benzoquinol methylase